MRRAYPEALIRGVPDALNASPDDPLPRGEPAVNPRDAARAAGGGGAAAAERARRARSAGCEPGCCPREMKRLRGERRYAPAPPAAVVAAAAEGGEHAARRRGLHPPEDPPNERSGSRLKLPVQRRNQ